MFFIPFTGGVVLKKANVGESDSYSIIILIRNWLEFEYLGGGIQEQEQYQNKKSLTWYH